MLLRNGITTIGLIAMLACSSQSFAQATKKHKHPALTPQVGYVEEDLLPQESNDQIFNGYSAPGSLGCDTPVWAMCQVRIAHHEIH